MRRGRVSTLVATTVGVVVILFLVWLTATGYYMLTSDGALVERPVGKPTRVKFDMYSYAWVTESADDYRLKWAEIYYPDGTTEKISRRWSGGKQIVPRLQEPCDEYPHFTLTKEVYRKYRSYPTGYRRPLGLVERQVISTPIGRAETLLEWVEAK